MTDRAPRRPTVIVTGGNGRIGRLLVDDLRRREFKVVSCARGFDAQSHEDDVLVDLEDSSAVRKLFAAADADAVVHLASVLRGEGLEETNARIDHAVAGATGNAGIRNIVYASSAAVYGSGSTARTESSPLAGDSPYARSKQLGERIFGGLARTDDVTVTVLRIFNVAGPAMHDSLVQRLMGATAYDPVSIVAADDFTRDYVHQDDLVEVFGAAIAMPRTGVTVLNVGAGAPVTTRVLLERLQIDPRTYVETEGHGDTSWADISELNRVLGIRPRAVPDSSWG